MMMIKSFLLAFMALFASTSAFVQRDVSSSFGIARSVPSDTSLNMALERQTPQVRKNVMAAAVSAAAMPAISTALTSLASTALPAALVTQGTSTFLLPSEWGQDPAVLGALFLGHWFVTNIVLQKFKDVGEA
eukprot:CAMPEP_0172461168 /NCGR_PEP_ID=MMETSP1065-20121228/39575_1 /TAXON_ID=265537 /ORGANISM="Amphiprora paludosa, Strain CCMP125" /LENGTH=131 /DNA_ID=CAMNT_0013216407 /DNA_START=29 /DNA_END=424 /DNA_ORIENTATION=-